MNEANQSHRSDPKTVAVGKAVMESGQAVTRGASVGMELEGQGNEDSRQRVWPERIGKFRILRALGRGGFGVVYLAEDELLRRQVALKVPLVGTLSDQQLRRQFLREAIAAAKLQHPNIVSLHEAIEQQDSICLSFAFCPGKTLQHWLEKQQKPIGESLAIEWVRKLAMAVEYSHRNGVVHRDIKPSNVILEERQGWNGNLGELEPKLTDFGLALIRDDADGRTVTLNLMGTPQYMAPEQLMGGRGNGKQVDIYGLGVLLYQLLTGRVPAPFETIEQAIRQIDRFHPVSPQVIQPEIPRDLSRIVMKCLEKEPEDRYPNAQALAEDLLNFQEGRPISIRTAGSWSRIRRLIARNPATSFITAAVCVVFSVFVFDKVRNAIDLHRLQQQLQLRQDDLDSKTLALGKQTQSLDRFKEQLFEKELELQRKSRELLKSERTNDLVSAGLSYSRNDPVSIRQLLDRIFYQEKEELGEIRSTDFATRFLWESLRPEGQLVETDRQSLWCMKATPDGKWMAVGGSKGSLVIHNASFPFDIARRFEPLQTEINALAFDETGSTLAAGCDDGRVMVWDFETGKRLHEIELESAPIVYDVRWIPGTSRLLASGKAADVYCIESKTGEVIRQIPTPHEASAVEFLSVLPDLSSVITGGSDGRICQIPLDGSPAHVISGPSLSQIRSLSAMRHPTDEERSLILYADSDSRLILIDLQGRELASLSFPDRFNDLEEVSSGFFACGDNMGAIHLVRLIFQQGASERFLLQVEQSWQQHQSPLYALGVAVSSNASDQNVGGLQFPTVFTGDRSGEMRVMGARNSNHRRFLTGIRGDAVSQEHSTWLREYDQKVIQSIPEGVAVMDWRRGTTEKELLDGSPNSNSCVQGSRYPERWISTDSDGSLTLHAGDRGERKSVKLFSGGGCSQAAYLDRIGSMIARGGDDRSFYLLDASTLVPKLHQQEVISMAVSPDERWIAIGSRLVHQVQILDTATLKTIANLSLGRIAPDFLRFTPDGRRLLVIGHLHYLSVWNTQDWQHDQTIPLRSPLVLSHTISSDSESIAIGDSTGRVSVWDLASGRELLELRTGGAAVQWLEFIASDEALVATTVDGTMEVFHATPLEIFHREVLASLKRTPRILHPIELR
jgi:serine/threonine protein kinase